MKLQIQREQLLQPLQYIIGVVERRQTMPILANVLVVADDNRLSLTATDLEVELSAQTALVVDQPGRITLPGRKLLDILRALPDEAGVTLTVDGPKATLRCGRSRFSLATLPADQLPILEDRDFAAGDCLRLPQALLKSLIERSHFAMAQQDVRYYLNGLLLEFAADRLRAVATDGHRLALSDVDTTSADGQGDGQDDGQGDGQGDDDGAGTGPSEAAGAASDTPAGSGTPRQVIVPRKGVQELLRLLSDDPEARAEIDIGGNHIRVALGSTSFTSKLIDGKFPDYRRAIPNEGERVATVDRRELRAALGRAAILANENRGVRLQLGDGQLRLQANNPEQEEAEEEMEIRYQGEPLEIGFNVGYLMDALAVLEGDSVKLFFADAGSSCLLREADSQSSQYVVSPMRL